MEKIFYRYNGYENLVANEYVCVKETECGYWIRPKYHPYVKKRFIYKGARASFAYPTKQLALNSFKIRKQWQIGHLKRQLNNAEIALDQVKRGAVDDKAECPITDELRGLL